MAPINVAAILIIDDENPTKCQECEQVLGESMFFHRTRPDGSVRVSRCCKKCDMARWRSSKKKKKATLQ